MPALAVHGYELRKKKEHIEWHKKKYRMSISEEET